MRKSMDRTGRGVVCAPASLALPAALSSAVAAPTPGKSPHIPFAGRFPVLRHGGIRRGADRCAAARQDVVSDARPDGAGRATRPLLLRGITVRNGLHSWEAGRRMFIARISGPHRSVNSYGRAGVIPFGGFRGRGNDARTVRSGPRRPLKAHHSARPAHAVMASAGTASGREAVRRTAYPDTPGGDSEVFGITAAPRSCAGRLTFRFPTRHPGYPCGALFVRADTRH
ncbi:hypothetical protein [Streptomyces kronopolitis]|uniref:hypothetical protein n=1 Tax=Streptomyces kronopolitis TaxID=1612435 RepID=UPI003449C23A